MIMRCRLFVVAVLALVLELAVPARAGADDVPVFDRSLVGQYLVAAPTMRDPNFAATVILVVAHDRKGALGLVVNRRWGTKPLAALLASLGVQADPATATGLVAVNGGGPVDRERLFLLHSADYADSTTLKVATGINLTTGGDILQSLAAGHGPQQVVVVLGYAGWASGQLEAEMARNDWLLAPVTAGEIFGDHPERLWDDVIRHAGVPL